MEKEMPILKADGEIVITATYGDVIYYAVKKGEKLHLKKAELGENK